MKHHIFKNLIKLIKNSIFYHWLGDNNFQNLIKNATTLLSGNMIAAVLGLLILAFVSRILGPSEFGNLVLITTFVSMVGTFVTFQSWQTVINYGANAIEKKDSTRFKQIIKFCTIIDFLTAIVGMIVAISLILFFGNLFSINAEILNLTILFSVTLLFNVSGTPTGILRLFGEFRLTAIQNIVSMLIKLIGILFVFFIAGANFFLIIIVWMVSSIIGNLILLFIGWNELKKHGYMAIFSESLSHINLQNPGIWSFIVSTNLTSSVRLGSKEMDILIIGGVLGSEAVGVYKIAKQLAGIPGMISDPLYYAIYPDLAKLWARRDFSTFKQLMFRSAIFAGCGGIAFLFLYYLFGEIIIQLLFGSAYLDAFPVSCLYMIGIIIAIFGFPLQPAMLAMGKPKLSLITLLISTILYLLFLSILIYPYGLIGVGLSIIFFYSIWSIIMMLLEIRIIKRKSFDEKS